MTIDLLRMIGLADANSNGNVANERFNKQNNGYPRAL